MPAPIRRTDELGFHIPATFDEAPEAGAAIGRSVRRVLWRWRWVLLLLLLPLLFYDKLLALGGHWIAERMVRQAAADYFAKDFQGALANLNRAIYWEPDPAERCDAYMFRGQIRQRLGQHREAIDDATEAVKFGDSAQRPVALNQRAYVRALAGVELEQGLEDIEQALSETRHNEPEFIDTRGYLRLRLGKLPDALTDFNNAIRDWEQMQPRLGGNGAQWDRWEYIQRLREFNRDLAVMRHHRGEAFEKLGKAKEAREDFDWAQQHGYNPADGDM